MSISGTLVSMGFDWRKYIVAMLGPLRMTRCVEFAGLQHSELEGRSLKLKYDGSGTRNLDTLPSLCLPTTNEI